jgi:hypothetical protein
MCFATASITDAMRGQRKRIGMHLGCYTGRVLLVQSALYKRCMCRIWAGGEIIMRMCRLWQIVHSVGHWLVLDRNDKELPNSSNWQCIGGERHRNQDRLWGN